MTDSHDRSDLLVVGSMAFDDLEGPFGVHEDVLGGSATFFALAAAQLTPRCHVVAVVGDDFPEAHLERLRAAGIDTRGVVRAAGKTFRWRGRYAPDLRSRETLDTQLGVFAGFAPRLEAGHCACDLVFLGNIHPALQADVLTQMTERPRLVALDTMNYWIRTTPRELAETLRRVDLLVVNDEEVRELAGIGNLSRAAAAVRAMGPRSIIVKRGDSGALLFHDGTVFAAPAVPLEEEVDPTGAGDSFAGGFMGYLARAWPPGSGTSPPPSVIRRAMVAGSVMGSFVVEGVGPARLLSLQPGEVAARFRAFFNLLHVEQLDL